MKIGVIGYGYWGPNLVRNFYEVPGVTVAYVSDLDDKRLALAKVRYPTIRTTRDAGELLRDSDVEAIVIATPVSSHYGLAMAALEAGKHVLIEKPMTDSSENCARLADEGARRNRVIMVDHTFAYAGAVKKVRELIAAGKLGTLYYYESVRVNLGLFQHDVNVVWDLAVHDLAIIDTIFEEKPVAVSALGVRHVSGQHENFAHITLLFDTNCVAHINVNWLAPVKVRQVLIGGSERMIVYDDLNPAEKIKVYEKSVVLEDSPDRIRELRVGYRTGDMLAPKLDETEPLSLVAREFVRCVESGDVPSTDVESGRRVVHILEAATQSIANKGVLVAL